MSDRLLRMFVGAVLVTGSLAATAAPAAAEGFEVHVEKNLEIPAASGNVMRANLFVPIIDGQPGTNLPTIVTYFPYVKDDSTRFEVEGMMQFAQAGYAGLLVDIPGTGVSPGEFGFLDTREIQDGRDAVEWAATQPFSNGRVGLWGYSYPGLTAAHIAATQPPALKAVVPASIFQEVYRDVVFPGGIMTTEDGLFLLPFVAGQSVVRQRDGTDPVLGFEAFLDTLTTPGGLATMAEAPTHTFYDEYWQERALENKIHNIKVPALMWGGWPDLYPRGVVLNYLDIGSEYKRLVMGPWGHLAGATGEPLQLFLDESLHWFDTFLRIDATPAQAAQALGTKIFDVDWDSTESYAGTWPGQFIDLPSWPPSAIETTLALCTDPASTPDPEAPWPVQGRLSETCGTSGSLPVAAVPVDLSGGTTVGHDVFADPVASELWDDKDQRTSTNSTAWVSEPLEEPTTLTGFMQANFWATTTGTDADWILRVVDIGPDGARAVAPAWLRASRRHEDTTRGYLWHTHDRTDALTPGEPYEMNLEIWPTSYKIPAGHRIGLLVRSADTSKVAPTPGSVVSELLTGPEYPSSLTFNVRAAGVSEPDVLGSGDANVDTGGVGAQADSNAPLPATGGGAATVGLLVAFLATRPRRRP